MANPRRFLAPLLLGLAGCGAGSAAVDVPPARAAEALRDGCVGETLVILQAAVDLLGDAAAAPRAGALAAGAEASGCVLLADGAPDAWLLVCPAAPGGELALRVTFLREGRPVPDAAGADGLRVFADGPRTQAQLELGTDPLSGLVVEGTLVTEAADGCVVTGTLARVTARPVADLPGPGVLFTSGTVDLGVTRPGHTPVTGTAALFGRRALVALEVDGVVSQGELALDRE